MKKKSYRKNSAELEELDTIIPFIKKLQSLMRWWFFSTFFLFLLIVVAFLFIKIKEIVSIIAVVLVVIFFIIFWFVNNKKNQKAVIVFLEYKPIMREEYFRRSYKVIFRFHQFIRTIDLFFIYPITFPLKIIWWFLYRVFKFRFKRIRKLILKDKKNILVTKDLIENDPFYSFLKREGLYDPTSPLEDIKIEIDEKKIN